jgi:hypothetical protein
VEVSTIVLEIGAGWQDSAEPRDDRGSLALAVNEVGEEVSDELGQTGIVTPGKALGLADDVLIDTESELCA